MQPIIYDVAVSVDGFISGPDGDISKFAHEGPVVDDYRARLASYGTAIMGRHTYEFGYGFGLEPGQNPYPHMRTVVFSETLTVPDDAEILVVRAPVEPVLRKLKQESDAPVYLCGGGQFAGTVLDLGLIDRLRFKRASILLGTGVPLFAGAKSTPDLHCLETKFYDNGYLYQEYRLQNR